MLQGKYEPAITRLVQRKLQLPCYLPIHLAHMKDILLSKSYLCFVLSKIKKGTGTEVFFNLKVEKIHI